MGSIEDRVQREMVFRERQEKVAHVSALGRMVARVFNVDAEKAFGAIISDYASEVFQETYDADLLREKIAAIRSAQERVRNRRLHDLKMISRLDRMGEFYDKEYGPDLLPVVKGRGK
jgi:hypothetical protein